MEPIRRVPPEMFRFTSGDRAELYTAILHAFGAANERLQTAIAEWAAQIRRTGVIGGSVAETRRLIESALLVLSRLPADGTPMSVSGEAAAVTLGQLRRRCRVRAPAVVRVVENPGVLSMAWRRFGPDCPPLVCTSGWPNSAVTALPHWLAEGGATLRYHGDFDGEGRQGDRRAVGCRARPCDAATGVAVAEERVVPTLLADLAAARGRHRFGRRFLTGLAGSKPGRCH